MIANCGSMHVNWERLSLSGYLEALEAHNEAHADAGAKAPSGDPEMLRQIMEARLQS